MFSETEDKLSKAFYIAPIAMTISTIEEGVLLVVNEAFERLSGYTSDEVIGCSTIELGIWSDPQERRDMVALLEREKTVCNRELMLRDKEGEFRSFIFSGVVFDLHGKKRLLSLVNDVTERKRTEEKLLASEEALRVIFNSAHDALFIHDLEGKIIDVNDKVIEMFGVDRRTALTISIADHYSSPDNPLDRLPVIWEMVVAGENQLFEWRARRIDNNALFDVEVSLCRIILNQRYAILATVRDITARKRAEQEIEILNTHLASHVMDLEAANSELEAFNYTVSHDLRSPLTAIYGYSDLLQDYFSERLGGHCLGYVREISAAAVKMNQLIGTLLEFSRMSRCEIRREEIDLTAIARGVAARLRMADPSRQLRFTFAEGVKVAGDANLLSVVMENLLGNAWKYTARQESALIEFGVDETGTRPACFVRDNGPGFDMDHADRLFRPFQRLSETTDFVGHGIGLATVQRIVERHGGSVWASGEPGKGATFYFTL